jgi:hypothetical protein
MLSLRMTSRIIAIGLALALALGGCSALPHSTNSGGGSSTGSQNTQKAALPASFPSSDVPLVGDDYAFTLALSDKSWSVLVRVDDAKAGFDKASDQLINAGFEKNSDIGGSASDVSIGLFTTDEYSIQMTSYKDSEFGPIVKYTVVKKS